MTKITEAQLRTIGEGQLSKAQALAALEGETMSTVMVEQMVAKEITEQGAIRVFLALQSTYGDKLGEFPEPDSVPETTNNPDKIKKPKVNSKGETTSVNTTWYTEFADATKEGKKILQELAWIAILRNPQADKNLVPAEFSNEYKNPQEYIVHEAYLTGRRTTVRQAYKKAMKLAFKMRAIGELNGVNIDFVWKDYKTKTEVRNTKKPLRISDVDDPNKWGYFTINNVERMDVDKATENGGTYDALVDTLKRTSNEGGDGEGNQAKPQLVRTQDTFAARLNDLSEALAFSDSDEGRKLSAELRKGMSAAGSDDYLSNIIRVHSILGAMLKSADVKTQVRIEALSQAIAKEAA